MRDWYVYVWRDHFYVVDTVDGKPVRSNPASMRDIVQAQLRGKLRD